MNSLDQADTLADGIRVAEPELAARLAALLDQPVTPRERDVIALLAEGLSNKEIGNRLGISPDTAKFHVGRLSTSWTRLAEPTPSHMPRDAGLFICNADYP